MDIMSSFKLLQDSMEREKALKQLEQKKTEIDSIRAADPNFDASRAFQALNKMGIADMYAIQPEINMYKKSIQDDVRGREQRLIQQYADDDGYKDPETGDINTEMQMNDIIEARLRAGDNEGAEALRLEDIRNRTKKTGGGGAGGATGARLSERNPELIKKATDYISKLRDTGKYDEATLTGFELLAETDPVQLIYTTTGKRFSTDEANRLFDVLAPKKVDMAARTTAAREYTQRDIQKENPILSEPQNNALTDAYSAVKYLNTLKKQIESGNVGYFDVDRKTGQFLNPQAADAYYQLVEIVGRKRSGAAINESEWKNFGKQILNKNFLLSDAGKAQAIQNINNYLDKFYAAGAGVNGDENWYSKFDSRAKNSRRNAETNISKYSPEVIRQAQEALNDPNAPEAVKAKARKVLGK